MGIIATVEVQCSILGLSARCRGKHNQGLLYYCWAVFTCLKRWVILTWIECPFFHKHKIPRHSRPVVLFCFSTKSSTHTVRLGSDPLSAWWLGLAPATLEFWVRFPNERNQGKQAHPVLKYRVPHGFQPPLGGLQIPRWLGSDPLSAWWLELLGLAPDTMEFWVRFPNERNQGKQAHPVLKYRVPHGSQTIFFRCICRCSRIRVRLHLHILLLHTQVSR